MAKIVNFLLCLMFFFLLSGISIAQIISPPKWDIQFSKSDLGVNEEVELVFKAEIPVNWYIYSNDFDPDLGPILTELEIQDSSGIERNGGLRAIDPKKKYEEVWEGEVTYFDKEGEFRQTLVISGTDILIEGTLGYQMCSDITGQCVNYEEDFVLKATALAQNNNLGGIPCQLFPGIV